MLAGVNIPLRDDDPDYPALVLGNYMLGGGFLNSRLLPHSAEGRHQLWCRLGYNRQSAR